MRDYEPDVSQILALYQQLEDDIISSMTKRMLKMGKVSESTKYEAEILQSAGLLYEDILNLIAQRTDATKQHVKALFEDAGVQTVEIDNQIHTEAGAVPIAIRQDLGMKRILEAGYKKTLKTMRNLVNTTANMVQTAFISSCDRAYMQVSSGAFSYQQAIRQAVKSFADIGATVKYPSGHTDKLDVAVRRAILTGVGQTSAMVAMERAKQADCYLMELTAHSGSRPDHAVWQGQLVSLTGKDVGKTIDGLHVFSLEQIGYQTGAGFKGWNCRHNWHPYYVGYSIPNYTKEQLAKLDAKNIEYNGKMYSEYEISQMQRAKERKVRALKRQVIASQTALENAPDDMTKSELQADYSKNAVKLKSAEKQLKEFCKQTGRRNDTFRTQVDGFGRSQAQKAVWATKKTQKGLTFSTDSGNIVGKQFYSPLSMDNIDACLDVVIRKRQEKYYTTARIQNLLKRVNKKLDSVPESQKIEQTRLWNLLICNMQRPIKLIDYKKEFMFEMCQFILNCYEKDMNRHVNVRKIFIKAIKEVPVLNKYTIGSFFCGQIPYIDENGNETLNTGLSINDELFKHSDSYIILLHELGHYIDFRFIDYDKKSFSKILKEDFENFKFSNIYLSKEEWNSKWNRLFSDAKQLSDIVSGITKEKIKGRCTHGDKYWEDEENLPAEAFAHFFEATIRNDKVKIKVYQEIFPNAYKAFLDYFNI